jgi:hypothetical protein
MANAKIRKSAAGKTGPAGTAAAPAAGAGGAAGAGAGGDPTVSAGQAAAAVTPTAAAPADAAAASSGAGAGPSAPDAPATMSAPGTDSQEEVFVPKNAPSITVPFEFPSGLVRIDGSTGPSSAGLSREDLLQRVAEIPDEAAAKFPGSGVELVGETGAEPKKLSEEELDAKVDEAMELLGDQLLEEKHPRVAAFLWDWREANPDAEAEAFVVTSRTEGFRRAGIVHSRTPVHWPIGTLSAAQLDALLAEPMLTVEIV